jgi:hypothetical protein
LNYTCVKHYFKSVHVSNLFWSREYNSVIMFDTSVIQYLFNLTWLCPLSFETGGTMGYNCCFFLNFVLLHIESPYNFGGTVPILYVITKMEEFYWKCNCYNKNTAFKMYTNQNTLQLIILNIDFSTEKIQIYQPVDLKTMKN